MRRKGPACGASERVADIASVSNNFVSDATLNVTDIQNNIQNNNVSSNSSLSSKTNTGEINNNSISSSGILILTTVQANVQNNDISQSSIVSIDSNTDIVSANKISGASIFSLVTTGASVEKNSVSGGSTFTIDSNSISVVSNNIDGGGLCTLTSTDGLFERNSILSNGIFTVTTSIDDIKNNIVSGSGIVNLTDVQAEISDNIIDSGSTFIVNLNTGVISRNNFSENAIVSIDTNSGDILRNTINSGGIFSVTSDGTEITGNIVTLQSIFSFSNSLLGAVSQLNEFTNGVTVSIDGSGAVSQINGNKVSRGIFTSTACIGDILNNSFTNVSITNIDIDLGFEFSQNTVSNILGTFTVPLTRNITNKYYDRMDSNFDTTKTVVAASGELIIDNATNYDQYCGIIFVDFIAGAETITTIAGGLANTINYQIQPLDAKTLTVTPTAIAGIVADQIALETLVNLVLTGRTEGADFLTVYRDGTINRQTNASVLA